MNVERGHFLPDSRFPIPDSRFPIPDSRFPIPDSRFPIPDSRFRAGHRAGNPGPRLRLTPGSVSGTKPRHRRNLGTPEPWNLETSEPETSEPETSELGTSEPRNLGTSEPRNLGTWNPVRPLKYAKANLLIDFSVIIPVRNGARTLGACLDGLSRQTVDTTRFEVIVVDDGSSDDTAAIARRFPVRLVQIDGRGASAARNRGLRESSGGRILFLDADCVPGPGWIEQMALPLAVRHRQTGSDDSDCQGTVGRFVSGQGNWVARMIQIELDRRYERMERFPDTDFVNTATCAFRKDALPEDPFDEGFGKLEDLELSFRLASEGIRMRYVSDAVVEHRHPESLSHHLKRRFLYGRFAPRLYRRYSGKALSDSSTPPSRRLQLVALGLAPLGLLLKWWVGVILLLLSLSFSRVTLIEAFRRSVWLGLRSPIFILGGNLAFLAGFAAGLSIPNGRRLVNREDPDHSKTTAVK